MHTMKHALICTAALLAAGAGQAQTAAPVTPTVVLAPGVQPGTDTPPPAATGAFREKAARTKQARRDAANARSQDPKKQSHDNKNR